MEEIKGQKEKFSVGMAETIFSNLKLYVEEKFRILAVPLIDLEDTRMNVATLSTILASKKLFTKEEFTDCYKEIRKSFGLVRLDGTMDGEVVITKYNWERENEIS